MPNQNDKREEQKKKKNQQRKGGETTTDWSETNTQNPETGMGEDNE